MSTLWTPGGEHKIEREPQSQAPESGSPPRSSDDGAGGPGAGGPGPRGPRSRPPQQQIEPDEAELDEVRRQLVEAPVEVVVANHAYGLFELAALHLSSSPPHFPQARLAIDALGALVEGLGDRLGEVEAPLGEALAQIRLAYVQISASTATEDEQPG